jgi:hypothetical protein
MHASGDGVCVRLHSYLSFLRKTRLWDRSGMVVLIDGSSASGLEVSLLAASAGACHGLPSASAVLTITGLLLLPPSLWSAQPRPA